MDPGRLFLYSLHTFTGLRFSWISLFSYIIGFTGLTVRLLSPCVLSVCLSDWTRYPLPWLSVSKTTSPQRKFRCSVQPLRPKSKVFIYSATQCSVVIVWRTCSQDRFFFSKRTSISFSERAVVAIGLFLLPCFFSSFSFALMRLSIS